MSDWQSAGQKRFALVRRPLQHIRIEVHPFVVAGAALFALALIGWAGATTTYALFRDEFLMQIVSRNTAAERASAAEIARLKNEVERVNSRILVERSGFVDKLDVLSRRQADVERRQETLSSITSAAPRTPDQDLDGTLRLAPGQPQRESRAPSSDPAALSARYDGIEKRQKDEMAALETRMEADRRRVAGIYSKLGLTPAAEPVKAGLGGLYIPLSFGVTDSATRSMQRLQETAAETARLRTGLDQIPVRSPAPGAAEASPFGNRVDPFLGTMAFHSGLDLEAPAGAPARATASGTVISAGWSGGYGLMVEVRHAQNLSTRYAHLSSISVQEGQSVSSGEVVGRVGSTGRSTGAHLHYETRLGDTALDPRRFLAAGAALTN